MSRCVVDTTVLQKANAAITVAPGAGKEIQDRFRLLQRIQSGELQPMYSKKLEGEWRTKVKEPRNDFVQAFYALVVNGVAEFNWAHWRGSDDDRLAKCKFPMEDKHLVRTAVRDGERTYVVSEEERVTRGAKCVQRCFNVSAVDLASSGAIRAGRYAR